MKKTYRTALNQAQKLLSDAGIYEYEADAWLLLEEVCNMSRTKYLMESMNEISEVLYDKYMDMVKERAAHRPLQYITGHQVFMNCDIRVNENVLIPRQDTEILVEEVAKLISEKRYSVLDMCTGSGCIAIALAKLCPQINVTAADISEKALKTANENAIYNEVDNVAFIHSDLFENIDNRYNVIVSNPPYIETEVIDTLMPEVKDFEPILALDGKADGLKFYREITKQSLLYIEKGGWLIYEIGCNQAQNVKDIMESCGYTGIKVVKDLAGLDRVVMGLLPN